MIPDYLIIDEIKRRREDAWQPEPLHVPLYIPRCTVQSDEDDAEPEPRIIIIDMVGDDLE